MDVIIDDTPFLEVERIDRPRSRTWPLPDPCLLVKTEREDEDARISVSNDTELVDLPRKSNESVSPRKNNRKNAWGNLSYADLITQAIDNSPEKRLTLAQIYDWMVKNVPYFKDKGDSTSSAGWKNSIRHNLSLHNRFMRVQNDQSGKSSYWVLNPDAKPGKTPRRRSGSVDGPGKSDRKRGGRSKKVVNGSTEEYGNNLSPIGSASSVSNRNGLKKSQSSDASLATSPCSSTDSLSNLPDLDENASHFILSTDSFSRPRSTSNVSTHSSVGRLTPIPGEEQEDDLALSDASLIVGRPRGSSAAEETASLVESMTLSRQADTINLDESLKFESAVMNSSCGYSPEMVRQHSDSFSSADSGYESPANYFVTSVGKPKQTMPTQMHSIMSMPKAPPPYPNPPCNQGKFTPVRQPQQNGVILARSQISQCSPCNPNIMPTDLRNQGFYKPVTKPSLQINPRGYISSQPARRLQHLPAPNGVFNGPTFYNAPNPDVQRNLTNMSDPNLASVNLSGMKEDRVESTLSQKSSYSQGVMYSFPIVPMEQDNDQFPSDLSHLELHDFSDRFQLQRDLESIIRNEMGEGSLDFEPSYSTTTSVNTIPIAGQNWVH